MGVPQTAVTIDDALIKEIVRRVLTVAAPHKIILFGSAARSETNRDSDIDLLIVDPRANHLRQESVRIGDALRGLGYPFDVVVISAEWFEASKTVIGGIAYPAHKYGKVIYESA